jgi:hypothetical protein
MCTVRRQRRLTFTLCEPEWVELTEAEVEEVLRLLGEILAEAVDGDSETPEEARKAA